MNLKPVAAIFWEQVLWQTTAYEKGQSTVLEKLVTDLNACNRGYANWALARWHASTGEWPKALSYIHNLLPEIRVKGVPSHIGVTLLVFSVLVHNGDQAGAEQTLCCANQHFGICPDGHLMACNLKQFFSQSDGDGLIALVELYKRYGLVLPDYKNLGHPFGLDNLVSKSRFTCNMADHPLVSIIIPVFNGESTLGTALHSLTEQSWRALEILVVDDCSTDKSLQIARQWAEQDSRIRVLANHTNQGAYAARNTGLAAAKGEFITTHDADDWSHCQKIELQVKALLVSPQHMASASHWARCSSQLVFGTWRQEASWIYRNVSSLMFRRSVFDQLGYWDRVSVNADTEYYYRIIAAYGQQSIIEVKPGIPLAFGRMEPGSLTMASETHLRTQFGGVRKDYMDAAHLWHRQQGSDGLYLSFNPQQRPFPVPALINRPGQYFGLHHYPVYPGRQAVDNEAKTILLCAHASGITLFGGERSFLDMARAVDQAGYQLVITLPEQGSREYLDALLEYASTAIVFPYLWWHGKRAVNERASRDFEAILDAYGVDLVHVNTLVLREPLLAARNKQVPGLVHVRELPGFDPALCEGLGAEPDQIRSNILNWADGFIVNSQCTQRYINQPERCSLLYNTVDASAFNAPPGPKAEVRFALVSSNIPKKGLDDFVTLARRAEGHIANARFILIGPDNEHIEALRACATLPANLVIAGYSQTPQQALNQADVILNLSSFQESFGRTIAEAMASGRPVIGYRWGALPELIDNGVNGFLVHLGDIEGLLRRVAILAEDPELLLAMGKAGRKKVVSHFGFTRFAETLKTIYDQWLG
ncbi:MULTISPECIES: glycosyltransferase [unclassified Endozoicomonas]|uniref:glycosyltransferase n=1 Tax=unclassified Endozoicomonas TaxID=2644528 RepID=UPI003BB81394